MRVFIQVHGRVDRLWRLVIIIEFNQTLLLVRRPVGPIWARLTDQNPIKSRMVLDGIHGRTLRPDISLCSPVPGQHGFLSGMLLESLFPVRLDEREQFMRDLVRPFVGDEIAGSVRMAGFCELPWGKADAPFPVHVQVMRLESKGLSTPVSKLIEDARLATSQRVVAPNVLEALAGVKADVKWGQRKVRSLASIRSDLKRTVAEEQKRPVPPTARVAGGDGAAEEPSSSSAAASAAEPDAEGGAEETGRGFADTRDLESARASAMGARPTASCAESTVTAPDASFHDFWGGDQAETGFFWDLGQTAVTEGREIEDSALIVLQRLPSHVWTKLEDMSELECCDTTRLPTRAQAKVIQRWAKSALGDDLLDLLNGDCLGVRVYTNAGGPTTGFVVPKVEDRLVQRAFGRGSFLEAVVLARVVDGASVEVVSAGTPGSQKQFPGYGTFVPGPFFRRHIVRVLTEHTATRREASASAGSESKSAEGAPTESGSSVDLATSEADPLIGSTVRRRRNRTGAS